MNIIENGLVKLMLHSLAIMLVVIGLVLLGSQSLKSVESIVAAVIIT